MIALGWTWPDAPPPAGVQAEPSQGLTLLSVRASMAVSPRQLMGYQLTCIASGLDLVPIAPARPQARDRALADPPEGLLPALHQIKGHVQFTVSSECAAWPSDATTGKGWLAARKAQHEAVADLAQRLCDAADQCGAIETRSRSKGRQVLCHTLIPRAKQNSWGSAFAEVLRRALSDREERVTVTGPWPPYAFVDLNEVEPA